MTREAQPRTATALRRIGPARQVVRCAPFAIVIVAVGLIAASAGATGRRFAGTASADPRALATQDQPPSFRTSVDVVRLDALVLDGGRPVTDLTARDFEVLDNGVPQRIAVERLGDSPIDVLLALDTSGSVAGRLLERLTAAAGALVDALSDGDRIALLTFSESLALRAPLTEDRDRVRRALAGVRAAGATSVVDALSAALSLSGTNGRPTLLLVFSDGLDTASWLTPAQLLDQARRSEVVIDGVVVSSAPLPPRGGVPTGQPARDSDDSERILQRVTAATGGQLLDGSRGERLSSAFVEALRSFRQRYEITYSPAGAATPGWHAIEVRLKRHRGATVRARPGYLR
jgi:VWFA-related protein